MMEQFETAVMFADVSWLTQICEEGKYYYTLHGDAVSQALNAEHNVVLGHHSN